jgi:hypothetical protein
VLPQSQDRVVFQKAIEHIKRLARRAGYYARAEHRILVGGVGVHGYRSLVIAKIPRVIRGKQGALLDTKALAIGRGSNAFSQNAADGKLMMEIDQHGIGGFDGVLAQKPAGHMASISPRKTFTSADMGVCRDSASDIPRQRCGAACGPKPEFDRDGRAAPVL